MVRELRVRILSKYKARKPISVYLTESWTTFEEDILGHRTKWYVIDSSNFAKVSIGKSRIPFLRKYYLGNTYISGSGIGIYCITLEKCRFLWSRILRDIHGIYFGSSKIKINEKWETHYTRKVPVPDIDTFMSQMKKKTRNSIRQAEKRGVALKILEDPLEAFDTIWRIKSRYGYWKRDPEVLKRFLEYSLDHGLVYVLAAYKDETPIGVATFLVNKFRKELVYAISGFDRRYQWYRPMNYLIYGAARLCEEEGFEVIDLRGGAFPDNPISKFKMGFGGYVVEEFFVRGVKIL